MFSSTCYLPSQLLLSNFSWSSKHLQVYLFSLICFTTFLHPIYVSLSFFTSELFLLCVLSPPHTGAIHSHWKPSYGQLFFFYTTYIFRYYTVYSLLFRSKSVMIIFCKTVTLNTDAFLFSILHGTVSASHLLLLHELCPLSVKLIFPEQLPGKSEQSHIN